MIELDTTIKAGDLYDYLLAHSYSSASGLLGSGVGAVMIVAGVLQTRWILIIAGVILLLYLPWVLFLKSRQQALNPVFSQPLHYVLDQEGISISQGEETQKQAWEDMYKAVSTGKSIILYTSRVNATILPRRDMMERQAQVIEIISTHMPPSKVKIRY